MSGRYSRPSCCGRLDDRVTGLRPLGHRRGGEVPLRAVNFGLFTGPPLGALEERQDVVPTPAAIAELRPVVVILRLAADVDEPVDRRRAAEHAAARIGDGAAVRAGIGLGLEAPGEPLVLKQLHIADRNMNERVPVATSGLDQDHASGRVFGETIGQNASGRSGADDHVIRLHLRSPFSHSGQPLPAACPMPPSAGVSFDQPKRLSVNPEGFEALSSRRDPESARRRSVVGRPMPRQ